MSQTRCFFLFFVFLASYIHAQNQFENNIDKLLKSYVVDSSPGFSVKVIKHNEVLYSKGFGLSNLDYSIENSDSTSHNLASIAKQFTAAATWALINDGKLALEDDIRIYLSEFPKYDNPVRIKHLLNHTSGIRNYHTLMQLSNFNYDKAYYDNSTVLQLICRQESLNNEPGAKVSYSNSNYTLLALIIEHITKKNLHEYLSSKILKPLGMTDTFVRISNGRSIKNKAVGYQKRGNEYVYSVTNQLSYGAGSMGSTINDMQIWVQMLNEQIPEFIELSRFLKTTEFLTTGKRAKYARGIMIDEYKGYEVASHSGFSFGGQSQLITISELGIGIVVLSNLQSISSPSIAYQILEVLLEDEITASENKDRIMNFKPQDIQQFVGEYKEISSDMTMKIFIENDTLKAIGSMGNIASVLVQYGTDKFQRAQSENVKYNFSPSDSHDMVISFGGTPFYFKRVELISYEELSSLDYEGDFYSKELNVTYHFIVENEKLYLSYGDYNNIKLNPIQTDEFGNGQRTLYKFVRSKDNRVKTMLLSCEGTVKDIVFKKESDY